MRFLHCSIKKVLILFTGALLLQACNKEFEDSDTTPPVINKPGPTGTVTLNELIGSDTAFSFLKKAIDKAGLGATLGNPNLRLTLFAPDNDAFRRSFIAMGLPPVIQVLDQLDAATIRSIVSYHLASEYLPDAR